MNMKRYDYLLVGAGLFNAILAYELSRIGKKCLVIDKRSHLGGNMYCDCLLYTSPSPRDRG